MAVQDQINSSHQAHIKRLQSKCQKPKVNVNKLMAAQKKRGLWLNETTLLSIASQRHKFPLPAGVRERNQFKM